MNWWLMHSRFIDKGASYTNESHAATLSQKRSLRRLHPTCRFIDNGDVDSLCRRLMPHRYGYSIAISIAHKCQAITSASLSSLLRASISIFLCLSRYKKRHSQQSASFSLQQSMVRVVNHDEIVSTLRRTYERGRSYLSTVRSFNCGRYVIFCFICVLNILAVTLCCI